MTTTLAGMTILGWLRNAGITEERARMHLAKGHVYADGVRVSDPDAPLAGAKIDLRLPVNRDRHSSHTAAGPGSRRRPEPGKGWVG
jgi:hypothetical protein